MSSFDDFLERRFEEAQRSYSRRAERQQVAPPLAPFATQSSNGKTFDFADPTPDMFDLPSMCRTMFRIHRFNGQLADDLPWTDGHHSILVGALVENKDPDCLAEAYAHDMVESHTGDAPGPWKRLIGEPYKVHERKVETVFAARYKLRFPWPAVIKEMDILAQDIEATLGMPMGPLGSSIATPAFRLTRWHVELVRTIQPMTANDLQSLFEDACAKRLSMGEELATNENERPSFALTA